MSQSTVDFPSNPLKFQKPNSTPPSPHPRPQHNLCAALQRSWPFWPSLVRLQPLEYWHGNSMVKTKKKTDFEWCVDTRHFQRGMDLPFSGSTQPFGSPDTVTSRGSQRGCSTDGFQHRWESHLSPVNQPPPTTFCGGQTCRASFAYSRKHNSQDHSQFHTVWSIFSHGYGPKFRIRIAGWFLKINRIRSVLDFQFPHSCALDFSTLHHSQPSQDATRSASANSCSLWMRIFFGVGRPASGFAK